MYNFFEDFLVDAAYEQAYEYDDSFKSETHTEGFFNEAEKRITELETSLKPSVDVTTYTRERTFFVIWFYLVLERIISYKNIDFYNLNRERVDKIIEYYRESLNENMTPEKSKIIEEFYTIFNGTGNYIYFEDTNNIPHIEVYENVDLLKTDSPAGEEVVKLKTTGSVLTIKTKTIKKTRNLSSLISPNDTYLGLSEKRVCRVINRLYGQSTGKELFVLDAKKEVVIPFTSVTAIYKRVENIFNSGKSAMIEVWRKDVL